MDTKCLEAVDTALQLLLTVHKTGVLGALLTIEPSVQLMTRSAIPVISVVTFEVNSNKSLSCSSQHRRLRECIDTDTGAEVTVIHRGDLEKHRPTTAQGLSTSLLGQPTILDFDLIKQFASINHTHELSPRDDFPSLFHGLGKLDGE